MSQSIKQKQTPLSLEQIKIAKQIADRKARAAVNEAKRKSDARKAKQLQKELYKNSQTVLEKDRRSKRDAKFVKNNLSPGKLRELLQQVQMDFQMDSPSRDIPRDSDISSGFLMDKLRQFSSFEFQALLPALTGTIGMNETTLSEVQRLNATLSQLTGSLIDSTTGQISLNHSIGEGELNVLNGLNLNLTELLLKLPTTEELKEVVSTGADSIQGTLLKYSSLAAFVFVIVSVIKTTRATTKINIFQLVFSIALFILLFASWLNSDVKQELMNVMDDLMEKTRDTREGFDHQMCIDDFNKVIELTAMGLFFFATSGMKKTGMPFVLAMSSLPRFLDTSKSVTQLVSGTLESIVNQFRRYVLQQDSISLFDEASADVQKFKDDCQDVLDLRYHGKLAMSVSNADRVNRIWTEGQTLLSKLNPREKNTMELRTRIREQISLLTKVRNEFQQSSVFAHSTRQVPTCILIRGASGVGKSTITMPLVEELLAHVLDEEDLDMLEKHPDSFIYTRMSEQKFWDAYRGQPICTFDDFGQLKDVAGGGENEFSEFIRAGNIFGYPLHMADLEAKGAVHFVSKMILASTNLQKISPNSIVEPEAVRRRFDLVVDQVPKIEFCVPGTTNSDIWSRRLDKFKCRKGLDKDSVEFHVVDLKDKEKPEGVLTGEVLSYQQLLERLVDTYQRHANQHADFKEAKNSSLSEAIKRRRAGLGFQMDLDDSSESSFSTATDLHFQMADEWVLDQSIPDTTDAFKEIKANAAYHRLQETYLDIDDLSTRRWLMRSDILDDPAIKHSFTNVKSLMRMTRCDDKKMLYFLLSAMPDTFTHYLGAGEIPAKVAILDPETSVEDSKSLFMRWLWELQESPETCWSLREEFAMPASVKWLGKVQHSMAKFADTIAACYKYVRDKLMSISLFDWYEKVKPFIPIAAALLGGLVTTGLAVSCWTMVRSFFGGGPPMEHQSTARGNTAPRDQHYVRNVAARAKAKPKGAMEHHFATDDTVLNQIADKVVRDNSYEFWSGSTKSSGGALFVKQNLLLIPWHYVTKIAESIENPESNLQYEDNIVLKKSNSTIEYTVPIANILEAKQATGFGTLDACLVQCPRYIPHHSDITKYFMTHDKSQQHRDKRFMLILARATGSADRWSGEHYTSVSKRWIGHETGFEVRSGYEYRGNFMQGHCGALMMVIDRTSQEQKIIGIHTGGDTISGLGFATAITREDLLETIELFGSGVEQLPPAHDEVKYDFNYDETVLDGRFKTLAKSSAEVHTHGQTEIVRSALYGQWGEAKSAPAKLRPFEKDGVVIDPFDKGLAKYCLPDVPLDEEYFKHIGDALYDDIRRESKEGEDFRILSFREAVEGIIGDKDFKSIPRSKSAGFPHNVSADRVKGKYKFFGDGQEFDFDRAEAKLLEARCMQIIKDAKNNKRQFHLYCDYLKDERRPKDKVAEGKTRIFSGCPLELLIVGRMYFGSWTRYMTRNKVNNGCAVGVNPYSHDWQRIANKLQEKGPYCGAGDYSAFDGSEKPLVHWAIKDVIQRFYNDGEENSRVRDILWMEVVNSKHIRGTTVYEWVSSLPSGHFLTIHINNMYNHFAFRYAWMREHDDDPASLLDFTKYVYLIVQGDDNLYSISPEKIERFNQQRIAVRLAEMGLTYTDELKSGEIIPHRPLEEVTFLKRAFRVEPLLQRYVAPLSMDTVLETPYWTKKGSERASITVSNTNDSLLELSLHGDEVFNEWAPKIIAAYEHAIPFEPLEHTVRSTLVRKSTKLEYEF